MPSLRHLTTEELREYMKMNITDQSDSELSLIVMNDEYLYAQRNRSGFFELIDALFIYTESQLDGLKQDLNDETD